MNRDRYKDIFTIETREALVERASGGCGCEVEWFEYEEWLEIAIEDRCAPCICEFATIASNRAEELARDLYIARSEAHRRALKDQNGVLS